MCQFSRIPSSGIIRRDVQGSQVEEKVEEKAALAGPVRTVTARTPYILAWNSLLLANENENAGKEKGAKNRWCLKGKRKNMPNYQGKKPK